VSTVTPSTHLFEASWEVCNKVGGIHTVLTTKLAYAQAKFPGSYTTVGPLLASNSNFHQEETPEVFVKIFSKLAEKGIAAQYGYWITDGHPPCILLGWDGLAASLNNYKATFWEKHQLNTLNTDFFDVDTPLLWSIAVGHLVAEYQAETGEHTLFHGHEWLSAGAFLVLNNFPAVKTVFTTHATVLGRALSSGGEDIYTHIEKIEPTSAAASHNVVAKHQLEALSAQLATVFTTVSSLTGREASQFLGRKPDIITENGVDSKLFPTFDALCAMHEENREVLHDFISAYFFSSYRFDLSNTTYQFTMGRYETHNKGYDLYLQSLGALNKQMIAEGSSKTVVAFFFVPGDALRVRPEVTFQVAVNNHLTHTLHTYSARQQRELYQSLWEEGEHCANVTILPKLVIEKLKQLIVKLPVQEEPPISPFDLRHPEQDGILNAAKAAGLANREEDRVKVIFFPAYFDGFDGIFNRSLYQLISGCDLGVFPSLYEPWGYTPMESLAMGVPGITSNLAGFGLAASERAAGERGSLVLEREGKPDTEVAANLTSMLMDAVNLDPRLHMLDRMSAYQVIQKFDWRELYDRYHEAYALATK
jgi:glycogen(starch) synthase